MRLAFRGRPVDTFDIAKVSAYLAAGVLAVMAVYSFLRLPIVAADTDLWYHMNGGRYIWTNKAIPHDSFFSFISPPRPWIDYYWLFQLIAFTAFSLASYPGLIVLRAILYAAAIVMIGWYLVGRQSADEARLYLLLVFGLYVVLLIPRYMLARPHIFSYTLLVAFLCILEINGRSKLLLPLLGLLWANVHGGAYPVMILVGLAYLVETAVRWLRDRTSMTRASLLGTVPIVVAMNMIYATPHGLALLRVPFTPTGPASRYINEFRLVQMEELLGFNISPDTWAPTYQTMFNLVALAACLAALASLWRWRLRLSHLLLFAGGVVLLTKGARFRYEFVLLALPLIAANPLLPSPAAIPTRRSRAILGLVTAVSLVMSISAAAQWFVNRPKYPLSPARLPTGVVTFLNQVGGGGRVLNQPNTGGYLQWMLYPRYKIFMDMEVPFLFTDEDMVVATNMFGDRQVLASVLDRYQPDFITVPISTVDFKQLIEAFPDYDAVFLDDTEVLYVNAAKHPEIARASALRGIDPFTLLGSSADKLLREKDTVGPALRRLVAIDPSGGGVNLALGTLDKGEGELTAALQRAEVVIEEYPESPEGYRLKAAVLRAQNRLSDSVRWYREALARAGGARKLAIQRELGVVYTELGLHEEGYRLLRDSLSVFDATTSYRDIFDLGVAALKAGRVREAALIFRLGAAKVPAGDKEWQDKYRQQNAALGDRVAR